MKLNLGDTIFSKYSIKNKFAKNLFVVRTTINKIVFCSNSKDFNEEYFELNGMERVLKTNIFFNKI